jgi:protein-S-isoprenylcysteine O-methyltransferase Ste14
MYAFLDLALLGVIIMARRQWPLVIWAGLVAVQASQARREARILEQAFGDAYRDYRSARGGKYRTLAASEWLEGL